MYLRMYPYCNNHTCMLYVYMLSRFRQHHRPTAASHSSSSSHANMVTDDDDFANRIIGASSSSSSSHTKLAAVVHLPQRYSSTTSSSSSEPPFTHTLLMSAMKAHPSSSTVPSTGQESYPPSATHTTTATHKDRSTSLRCRFNIDEPEDTTTTATTTHTHKQAQYPNEADEDEDDDDVLDSEVSMVTKKVRLPSTRTSNYRRAGGADGAEADEEEEIEYNVIDAIVDISTNEESSPFLHTLGSSYTPSYR